MENPLYSISDRHLLASVAALGVGFQPPAVVLEGLTEQQATAKPQGVPHSIAEIVSHMCYWQEYFNHTAAQGFRKFPSHAAQGWPPVEPGSWPELRERFLLSLTTAQDLALQSSRMEEKLLPSNSPLPFWQRESVGSGLLHAAFHGAHHLGQIVTLRQLMGLWPPAAGSLTW